MSYRYLVIVLLVATCAVAVLKLSRREPAPVPAVELRRVSATSTTPPIRADMIRSDVEVSPAICADLAAPDRESIRTLPGADGVPEQVSASELNGYLEQAMATEALRLRLTCGLYRQLRAQ